jgi:bifunctional non-homologous end joining protein LigD
MISLQGPGLLPGFKGDSLRADRRSGALVKAKLTRVQEFVIGGYTPPEGSCKHFGALRPAGATQP